ncbi:MAG TPA: DUF1036 domain-containing protein [Mucilaginibacter sp.]|nr:DUF1036 domain-containing protein [Mucilaginibacter sp.]
MKQYARCLIIVSLVLLVSLDSFASLKVYNNTRYNVILVLGYMENGSPVSEGWYVLNPMETKVVSDKPLLNRYYYYAIGNGSVVWRGSKDFFISSTPNFKIKAGLVGKYADVSTVKFKVVDIGLHSGSDYTILLIPPVTFNNAQIQVPDTLPKATAPRGLHQARTQ